MAKDKEKSAEPLSLIKLQRVIVGGVSAPAWLCSGTAKTGDLVEIVTDSGSLYTGKASKASKAEGGVLIEFHEGLTLKK